METSLKTQDPRKKGTTAGVANAAVEAPLTPDEPHAIILHRRSRQDLRRAIDNGAVSDARIIAALNFCL